MKYTTDDIPYLILLYGPDYVVNNLFPYVNIVSGWKEFGGQK